MPWCDSCAKFWNPNSMPPDGTCPTCGAVIAEPPDTKVPWHFWLLVVGVVGYLGWRAVQGVQWLLERDLVVWAVLAAAVSLGLVVAGVWWVVRGGDEDVAPE